MYSSKQSTHSSNRSTYRRSNGFEPKDEENTVKVLRQISDFNCPIMYQREIGLKTEDHTSKETQSIEHSPGLSYTFRPKQEEVELSRLKEKIEKLEIQVEENRALNEKAYLESSRILKECQTTCNAYVNLEEYDPDNKENFSQNQHFKKRKNSLKFK